MTCRANGSVNWNDLFILLNFAPDTAAAGAKEGATIYANIRPFGRNRIGFYLQGRDKNLLKSIDQPAENPQST